MIYIIFNKDKFITKVIACLGIIQRSSTISFLIPKAHLITFIRPNSIVITGATSLPELSQQHVLLH